MKIAIKSKLDPIDWLKMFRAHEIELSCGTPLISITGSIDFDDSKKIVTITNKDNYCKLEYDKLNHMNTHGTKTMSCKYGTNSLIFIAH